MIVAGLDEAGYGPLLGPLVVGCCAFDIKDHADIHELPCLWQRLSRHVSKKRSASGKKLHINDSKLVYSSANGLKELERSVLAVLAAMGEIPESLNAFVEQTAAHVSSELHDYPWYQETSGENFPIEQAGLPIKLFANALRNEMNAGETNCVYYSARVVLERQLNRMIANTNNKATVLFCTTAIHLDYLLKTYGHQPMTIFCDRQGGRECYRPLLRLMFEEWDLDVLAEKDGLSEYLLKRAGSTVRILFREKAETQCLPVALASMLSKYLREALMQRFNAFWLRSLPGVSPTAGYYQDGTRFLRDINSKRQEMGIADDQLVRCR